jgi:hypothetical protein
MSVGGVGGGGDETRAEGPVGGSGERHGSATGVGGRHCAGEWEKKVR